MCKPNLLNSTLEIYYQLITKQFGLSKCKIVHHLSNINLAFPTPTATIFALVKNSHERGDKEGDK